MAVTKIHPIKSTLKKALDYIENPDKTEGKMLVTSFGCSYETADIEFEMLLAQAIQKGNNLAHHLIQSFAPGEATPEQAHEIGKQLADEVLQGKYSYVLTTHIDKGHVHNHLIFCAVDMVNHRKYNSNRQSYAYIRRTSDRLCREHGLSVVQPSRDKGKSYAECVVLRGALQVHITFPERVRPGRAGHPQKRPVLGLVAGSGPPDDLLVDLKIVAIKGGVLPHELFQRGQNIHILKPVHGVTPPIPVLSPAAAVSSAVPP